MNRIRKINNTYQVLVNQNYTTNPSIELTLGSLTDEKLLNYEIVEFQSMQDALNLAYNMPDINFNKISSSCVDAYKRLNKLIQRYLKNMSITFKSKLLNPNELKTITFDRISNLGNRFTFLYNFNDVIAFDIINPWTNNLINISNILVNIPELNIIRIEKQQTHIKLVGLTEMNTTFEIRLWTSLIYNFMEWIYKNNKNINHYQNKLLNILQQQIILDNSNSIIQ